MGRVANRIAKGLFVVDGVRYQLDTNSGPNAIHGGLRGFSKASPDGGPPLSTRASSLLVTSSLTPAGLCVLRPSGVLNPWTPASS